jgi:hypothetical protein
MAGPAGLAAGLDGRRSVASQVTKSELLAAAATLAVSPDALSALYEKHSGADKVLQRAELAGLLAELGADLAHEEVHEADVFAAAASAAGGGHDATAQEPHSVSGPSAFVVVEATQKMEQHLGGKTAAEAAVWPEELVLALAAYCEQSQSLPGEIVLHVYPFGGVRDSTEMLKRLSAGTWPSAETS